MINVEAMTYLEVELAVWVDCDGGSAEKVAT